MTSDLARILILHDLRLPARFGRFDQFPEFRILLKRLVFGDRQIRAVEKIFEAVFIQNAIHNHAELVPLKVNAIISDAEAVQVMPRAIQAAILVEVIFENLLRQAAEFAEDIELKLLRHFRQLSRAGRIEYDLERAHPRDSSNW